MKTWPDMLDTIGHTKLAELAADSARLKQFGSELRPTNATLPRTDHGASEPPAVKLPCTDISCIDTVGM